MEQSILETGPIQFMVGCVAKPSRLIRSRASCTSFRRKAAPSEQFLPETFIVRQTFWCNWDLESLDQQTLRLFRSVPPFLGFTCGRQRFQDRMTKSVPALTGMKTGSIL